MQKTIQSMKPTQLTQRVISSAMTVYFFATVALIGFLCGYLVTAPLYLLARKLHFLQGPADFLQCFFIRQLMRMQPGLRILTNLPSLGSISDQIRFKRIFIVANHRSHLDVFLLISLIPGLRLLAKQKLFRIPFLAPYMHLTQQIPLASGSVTAFYKAMQIMKEKVAQGERVLAFPELTRSPADRLGTLEFRPAIFQVPFETKAMILPLVILGTDRIWPKGSNFLLRGGEVEVKMLPLVDSTKFSTSADLCKYVRNQIDSELL